MLFDWLEIFGFHKNLKGSDQLLQRYCWS